MIAVAQVALDGRVSGSLDALTYLNSSGAKRGQIVLAPLGSRTVFGVVLSASTVTEEELPVALGRMRSIGPPIFGLDVPSTLVDLAEALSGEYLTPMSMAVSLLFPPGIQNRLVSTWVRVPGAVPDETLNAIQEEVLRTIDDLDGKLSSSKSKPIAAAALRALRQLKSKGWVMETLTVQPKVERALLPEGLRLTQDESRIEKFLLAEGRKKPAQALTLMRLQGSEGARFSPQEIKALSGVTDQTLKSLLKAGLLEAVDTVQYASFPVPVLAEQQRLAFEALKESLEVGAHQDFLLFGVTGSGKTEVYLRAAAEALRLGKQILYLVPEIALTAQVISQLRGRFGSSVAVLHSNLGPQERLEAWMRVAKGEAPVVLGARSALFAPLSNIGLIVLDEEHEQSYKQESTPRYHTKRMARKLASLHGATLVLGSATPSIESFWESETRALRRLEMPVRAAKAQLPTVTVMDLATLFKKYERPSLFSPDLRSRLEDVLERKEQAILFLNRRAYAPYLSCRECGFAFKCENCAVSLAYHKRDGALVCHYCGHREGAPELCPDCGGFRLNATGAGSEKVEELLREEFPEARVARLDRDIAKKKGVLEETFALMRAGEIDFLVGTQMVAKGLDFPGVTLVGVIVADTALHLPDFRASERTFQLLSQVAGRAGRGQKPGEVVIQTFSPDHPAVVFAQKHDYLTLYESLLAERESVGYPPFNRLVNVLFTGANRNEVIRYSADFGRAVAAALPTADVLGPVDCNIERLNNLWRRHLLVKAPLHASLAPIAQVERTLDSGKVSVTIDVDPYTML